MIINLSARELRSLFQSPLAWTLLAVLTLVLAWLFLVQIETYLKIEPNLISRSSEQGVTDLIITPLFDSSAMIFLLITPLLTMRLLSEEYRTGTIQLLLSSTLSTRQIILGKYLALLGMLACALLLTALLPFSLLFGADVDTGRVFASLLGLALLISSYGAIGLLLSSLTEQPAVAAVGTYGVLLFLWIINLSNQSELFGWLSLANHYRPFLSGVVNTGDISYFILIIGASLLMSMHQLVQRQGVGNR
ncbi:MAG: ABC transporter permease subunit [Sedimenticola sp.]|nr:ABC transporter permease subunit [Sedimenticola sp.]